MSNTSSSSSRTEGGGNEGSGPSSPAPRRNSEPSSSRRRSAEAVWPEHFVEAVAIRVASDAAASAGRLAAAPALASFFQVFPLRFTVCCFISNFPLIFPQNHM
ncbi:hypothetical protein IHE45_15G002400 [Dioscorea alata]|uniref:Uncharacterized protein n=1 Tax=Dioscorea alata TaxID=55571 RepID=A0ACB7UJB1_DIOAL|nr:hypothetical protein IHE45_15G002400 [Dioscorea alata]